MLHKILTLVCFVSLGCVTAAASNVSGDRDVTRNEYTVSREKRAFPAAPNVTCTYEREAMRDLEAILKAVTETNSFSATESARIFQVFTGKYISVDECDSLIRSILANCKDIIDLRKNGKTEELEAKLKNLQINLDSVDRKAMETESTLRQSFNNIEEALKQELRQSELERQQAEKNHEQAVLKLVTRHLQAGDVDLAVTEFTALTNRDALAGELVQTAHSDSKVQLLHLAQFACKIDFYTTAYLVINSLYKGMQKNQLEEMEMILLYYRIINLKGDNNFILLTSELKNNYYQLEIKLSPHNNKIISSLVSEIQQNSCYRSEKVVKAARSISNVEQLFLIDLIKIYKRTFSKNQLPQLYRFIRTLKISFLR